MSKQLKLRRGTTAQHSTFTGASGEVTVDTDKKTLVVHDGTTAGGNPVLSTTAGAVGATNLADNAVTTAKITDASVTAVKLASGAAVSNIGFTPANSAVTVNLTGNQTVAGVKTFSSDPVMGVSGLSGNIAAARITSALNASGSAPIYACRAWVNFNGTGTVAIRASGNVSSITDRGVGQYTLNFTTAMPDANFGAVGSGSGGSDPATTRNATVNTGVFATGSVDLTTTVDTGATGGVVSDFPIVSVSIFR